MDHETRVSNFVSIDLEDWFHQNYKTASPNKIVSTVEANTMVLLDLLGKFDVRATFFCLGQVAQKHGKLIKRIHEEGHEIASHGQNHNLAYSQSPQEFKDDVRESKVYLEELIGEKVHGYRAPSWSITTSNLWALEVLEELGFSYDSSIFPMRTFLYGVDNAPRFPYIPRIPGTRLTLVELPASTYMVFGRAIGFGGGFYLRFLPIRLQVYFAASLNEQGHPFLIYMHPREIDSNEPRLPLGFKERLIHYWGISGTERKLGAFLQRFKFILLRDFVTSCERDKFPILPVTQE